MHNKLKRIFAFLLCLAMLTGIFPTHAHAEEAADTGTISGYLSTHSPTTKKVALTP